MKAIGIDIGTTSVCGVLIDAKTGDIIKSVTKNSNAFIKSDYDFEKIQSVDKILATCYEILDGFITSDVCVIGVTGQMHGIVYTDKDGNAVSNLYTWQDERGNLPYKNTTYAKYLGSFSGYGNVTDFYNTVNGLKPSSAVSYCTIGDYLVMKLCGLVRPVLHSSNASSLGCYDIANNKFTYENKLAVIDNYYIAGKYKGIPVSVAIGDNQASVLSTLASQNDVLVNVGTGSQVSVVKDEPITKDNIETRPYFDGKYLIVGSSLCGGRAYSILKDFYAQIFSFVKEISDDEVYSIMNKMIDGATDTALTVDTRFAGTRQDADIRGSISGVGIKNFNPSSLTVGVINGIATELYDMYKLFGVKAKGLVASGNGIRKNKALKRAFEDKFGALVKTPAHLEEASVGTALFGLVCVGAFKNISDAQKLIKYEV